MVISRKITSYIERFYKRNIFVEQYPMLTTISRKSLMKDGAMGVVFMLHHISKKDPRRIPTNEDLKVSPAFLEQLIVKYQKKGFDFISLDKLYTILTFKVIPDRPFVLFTIDDGYLDNYTNGLPVFEKYQVPFAIFVATDFVDKKAILWWDSLEYLIMTHDEVEINTGERYSCRTFQKRWDTFRVLREKILNLDQSCLESELTSMFAAYETDWYAPIKTKGMNWEQIRELAYHPLCTIGGHTISHPSLAKLSFEDATMEIKDGLTRIEMLIQKEVSYFAYPYGTPNEIGEREYQIVENLGLKMAFMAHQGCVSSVNKALTHLPRVYLKETKL